MHWDRIDFERPKGTRVITVNYLMILRIYNWLKRKFKC